MPTPPVLAYAQARQEDLPFRVMRAVTLAIFVLALIDVAMKLYSRGATLPVFYNQPGVSATTRDLIATFYYDRLRNVPNARLCSVGALIITSVLQISITLRKPRPFIEWLIPVLAWSTVVADCLLPAPVRLFFYDVM